MSQELKPCPFCSDSSYPENVHPYSLRGYWVVRCSGCESEGPAENTEFDAIAAWNKRAQPAGEAVKQRYDASAFASSARSP